MNVFPASRKSVTEIAGVNKLREMSKKLDYKEVMKLLSKNISLEEARKAIYPAPGEYENDFIITQNSPN
jgi:hypothetical protein